MEGAALSFAPTPPARFARESVVHISTAIGSGSQCGRLPRLAGGFEASLDRLGMLDAKGDSRSVDVLLGVVSEALDPRESVAAAPAQRARTADDWEAEVRALVATVEQNWDLWSWFPWFFSGAIDDVRLELQTAVNCLGYRVDRVRLS